EHPLACGSSSTETPYTLSNGEKRQYAVRAVYWGS
ncbi:hypothetical protein L195_g064254, partial [Trifolium pratense]